MTRECPSNGATKSEKMNYQKKIPQRAKAHDHKGHFCERQKTLGIARTTYDNEFSLSGHTTGVSRMKKSGYHNKLCNGAVDETSRNLNLVQLPSRRHEYQLRKSEEQQKRSMDGVS